MCSDMCSDNMDVSGVCAICKQPIQVDEASPTATLGEKGSASINKASETRGDTTHSRPGQQVHQDCRRRYCNPHQVAKTVKLGHSIHKPALRSTERQFTWNTDCFFCGQPAKMERKRKSSDDVYPVKTIEMRSTILAICHERGDAWAVEVQARLMLVHDLHAAEQCTTKSAMVISVQRNRSQQSTTASLNGQNQVALKTKKGWMHSWKWLVFLKRMMMNRSPSMI